ncbi:hypothetical protein RHGRI_000625 [Rhododendron griersonianum]|uniref:F-box domain-containing protein n=1 Tax=Rhododendron griersonianum TaxID=479676 RepID=A0AAV6LKF1_9ERIC|nr:hypothetical protein RHGRI_000625 [Rhododendron griersonianum]
MKRGRKPKGLNTLKVHKEADQLEKQQNQYLGPSLVDLPEPISFDILLRLSTKSLLTCRCVCKPWRKLISDPEFARLHFARAEAFPLIRFSSSTYVSRNLYLIEPPEDSSGCDREYCDCHMKLETKLKIPLRNAELVMNREGDANVGCNSKGGVKQKRCIKLRPKDHKLNVVNSCNGLLCLSEPSLNDPVMVCNPITGEFINLPIPTQTDESSKKFIDSGLGFSPKTNEYKVIRMFDQQERIHEQIREPIMGRELCSRKVAEIHNLGTGAWKRIGCAPRSTYGYNLGFPTYLSGSLHWLLIDHDISDYIMSFNFDVESFRSVPQPPLGYCAVGLYSKQNMSLGVLRGRLCLCDCSDYGHIDLWMMEKYCVQESWKKTFRIRTVTDKGRRLYGLYEPISFLGSGGILFFHRSRIAVFHFNAKEQFSSLKFLKDTVTDDDLEVLNITSRCAAFKLEGETRTLFLKEEIEHSDPDSLSDPDYNGLDDLCSSRD